MRTGAEDMGRRLTRSRNERMVAGICGGLGEYFSIDPTIVRLLWAAAIFVSAGAAFLLYVVGWIVVPESDRELADLSGDATHLGRRLMRSRSERMLAGVCGGLGEYFGADPVLFRLLWVLAAVFTGGMAVPVYFLFWIVMPESSRPPIATPDPFHNLVSDVTAVGEQIGSRLRDTFRRKPAVDPERAKRQHEQQLEDEILGLNEPDPYAEEMRTHRRSRPRNRFWLGVLLIGIGTLILLNNLGLFWWVPHMQLWPILGPALLIITGLLLLVRRR